MKVALFYPWNFLGGWGACGGYATALRRAGHEVVDYPFPGNQVVDPESHVKKAPTLEQLNSCGAILSLHHEYVQPWLEAVYDYDKVWKKVKTPVVARLDESVDRFDLAIERRLPELRKWADVLCYPAAQDAEKHGAPWVPHAVDVEMFRPKKSITVVETNSTLPYDIGKIYDDREEKKYDLAFIGSYYQPRRQYAEQLANQLGPGGPTFHVGMVAAQDLSGPRGDYTMPLLAENYRRIKVFFCLPPLSRLVVTKAFEVMACGTFLMYPRFPGVAQKNEALFEDGVHLAYYDLGQFVDNARQIVDWLFNEKEREKVAKRGAEQVAKNHSYERFFDDLLKVAVGARGNRERRGIHVEETAVIS